MSHQRQWDENRSPQWKYLFRKEAQSKRKTRKEIERERKITKEESAVLIGADIRGPIVRSKNTRKVSKEELKAKLEKEINSYHKG